MCSKISSAEGGGNQFFKVGWGKKGNQNFNQNPRGDQKVLLTVSIRTDLLNNITANFYN